MIPIKKDFLFNIGDVVRLVHVCEDWATAERMGKEFVIKHRSRALVHNVYTIQSADGDGSTFYEHNLKLVSKARK